VGAPRLNINPDNGEDALVSLQFVRLGLPGEIDRG